MIRKILRTTDPKLRQISRPVEKADKKLLELIKELEQTLKAQNDPEGLGLAAPQIGEFRRVFIVLHPKTQKVEVFINPELVKTKKTSHKSPITNHQPEFMEGCLSLPHYYGPVRRSESVTVKYVVPEKTATGYVLSANRQTFRGFLAHIIQHEVDHLNGIFFVDRLLEQKRKLYQLKSKEWIEIKLV